MGKEHRASNPADPGVFPLKLDARKPLARKELFGVANSRAKFDKRKPIEEASNIQAETVARARKGWPEEPFIFAADGKLVADGGEVVVNAAYRFGVQQTDNLRATNSAAAVRAPISHPFRGIRAP